ncbi:MAG TPA: VOC family protein [Frankiaceae bacterium]|nr:VOC family protein [Frankiaceae bacterium]
MLGFSHVSLSVRDRDRSAAWYTELFGFEVFEQLDEPEYVEAVLLHRATGTILCLQQHRSNAGEPFDPRRTGADHVAFRIGSRDELVAWEGRLAERGVPFTPVVDRHYGSVLCLRDPDGIQLELFYREQHP